MTSTPTGHGVQDAAASVVLGAYPAKQCPRVTHNTYAPTSPTPASPSEEMRELFAAGNTFEEDITGALAEQLGGQALVLDETPGEWEANIAATLHAMRCGVPVIVNGRLPETNGRCGAPDVLVSFAGGYLPVDIKNHQTIKESSRQTVMHSRLAAPALRTEAVGWSGKRSHRYDDALQLAHYTRMLQDLGHHPAGAGDHALPGLLIGGIIGTSDFTGITGERFGITWYDLAAPEETTYSASAPEHRAQRSLLERYDHEFGFRHKVAAAAREGREIVRPIGTWECGSCIWAAHCAEVAGEDDPTFAITAGRLDAREWLFLQNRGGATIEGLAALDVDEMVEEFADHSVGRRNPAKRLTDVVARARMVRDGIDIEPLDAAAGWPVVPTADVEIDFDIEWDRDGRIYQWGLRIRDAQDDTTAQYQPVVSFDPLDDTTEEVLADEFADHLEEIITAAEDAGKSVTIFHWHHVEVSMTRKFTRVAELLDGRSLDLLAWFNTHLRAQGSAGLKAIAPLFGFAWGVDDAGGYMSLNKIEEARTLDGHAARAWCLTYNESDVAAQAAIRDGLRAREAGEAAA